MWQFNRMIAQMDKSSLINVHSWLCAEHTEMHKVYMSLPDAAILSESGHRLIGAMEKTSMLADDVFHEIFRRGL